MVWVLVAAIACSTTDASPPPGPPSSPELKAAMQEHRAEALAARDAVVRGDLDGLRAAAGKLEARLPLPGLPAELEARQDAVKAAARDAANANSLADGGEAVGRIAQACGECHDAAGASPKIPSPSAPNAADGIPGEMSRHRAAADLLWLGLVRPDDQAIKDATATLAGGNLVHGGADADPNVGQAEREMDAGVHELAAVIETARDQRGVKYGQLLATCATCHLVMGGGPRPQ